MKSAKLSVFVVALASVTASCAVPKSGEFVEVNPNSIPFDLNSPETTIPATTIPYAVQTTIAGAAYEQADFYFIKSAGMVRVRLEIPSPTDPQAVFAALIAGLPDPAHTRVTTLLPTNFSATVEVYGGVANVNAKRGYLDLAKPSEQRLAIAQIVLTLTSQPGIGQVTFSVAGKPIGVPRGRGDIAGAGIPVTFDDYKMLVTS
ncbi:MAG: hypothetical protein EBR53_05590 [Actinobacteria bacterium]|nr:hypothetical protein [Actinomycetota bacterium]